MSTEQSNRDLQILDFEVKIERKTGASAPDRAWIYSRSSNWVLQLGTNGLEGVNQAVYWEVLINIGEG